MLTEAIYFCQAIISILSVGRATLMAGSPESDMGALRKEKEKMTVHPFVKVL